MRGDRINSRLFPGPLIPSPYVSQAGFQLRVPWTPVPYSTRLCISGESPEVKSTSWMPAFLTDLVIRPCFRVSWKAQCLIWYRRSPEQRLHAVLKSMLSWLPLPPPPTTPPPPTPLTPPPPPNFFLCSQQLELILCSLRSCVCWLPYVNLTQCRVI